MNGENLRYIRKRGLLDRHMQVYNSLVSSNQTFGKMLTLESGTTAREIWVRLDRPSWGAISKAWSTGRMSRSLAAAILSALNDSMRGKPASIPVRNTRRDGGEFQPTRRLPSPVDREKSRAFPSRVNGLLTRDSSYRRLHDWAIGEQTIVVR